MRNIKLTIEYAGTDFNGWQVQSKNQRTVQGELEKAIKRIFKKSSRLIGSGRTDAGVHALGQVANFTTPSNIPIERIVPALNANLPDDIAVTRAEAVPLNYHAQFSAKRKTYRYTILNRRARTALEHKFCHHIPHTIDLKLLRAEAKHLVGRKDFRSFTAADPAERDKPGSKDTVRTIYKIAIKKSGDFITIDVTANGFLYKMVRNIVGTLLDISSKHLPPGSIKNILKAKSRRAAGTTAPAKGLMLLRVF